MAKNDVILLDGLIDDLLGENDNKDRGEIFEFFAYEQIFKDYDLSLDEIEAGAVDGRNDGGIDGFYIFINGQFLTDPETFPWPRSGAEIEVYVITCKHQNSFKQAPLDLLVASISELFDLGLQKSDMKGSYSDVILGCRENLKYAYRRLSSKLRRFKINYIYASRGDASIIGESVNARSSQLIKFSEEAFGSCEVTFSFVGSAELVELSRKVPNFCLELPFEEVLSRGERYVVLATLEAYYDFISEEGSLRRYLLDSNVRAFMGLNRVNTDIKNTLSSKDDVDFWWLNNGITILATSASVIGDSIQLRDIQIVNGLQTTESIFRYFNEGGTDADNRSVLIKVIVSKDDYVRDSIIRATNNQTNVAIASLHATDSIQRDIEDILLKDGIYYERRKNFYRNQAIPMSDIVEPLYLAASYVSLVLKSPSKAVLLKERFMRNDDSYSIVFSSDRPIGLWPILAKTTKLSDSYLNSIRSTRTGSSSKLLRKWRHLLSFISVARLIGSYSFSNSALITNFDEEAFKSNLSTTWEFLSNAVDSQDINPAGALIRSNSRNTLKLCAENFNLDGVESVEVPLTGLNGPRRESRLVENSYSSVSMDFALQVDKLLPEQPWKPGAHKPVIEQLDCSSKEYSSAVRILIEEGLRHNQIDGVVYDSNGNVLRFDPERVDSETLELRPENNLNGES